MQVEPINRKIQVSAVALMHAVCALLITHVKARAPVFLAYSVLTPTSRLCPGLQEKQAKTICSMRLVHKAITQAFVALKPVI